jgi:pimeloyl-ACP methyl ester carboxylesterase
MAHSGFFAKQRSLASEFRLIGIDLRGHGRSLADGKAPTIEQMADDVSEIAEALELEQAIAVGWSLGRRFFGMCSAAPPPLASPARWSST